MAKIQPPIIDRSVTAFPCLFKPNKDSLRVYFYFSSLDAQEVNINTKYILAKVLLEGRSIFLNNGAKNASAEPFIVWPDDENFIKSNRYYIEIPSAMVKNKQFNINTVLSIQLQELSNNITSVIPNFFQSLQNRVWNRDYVGYLTIMNQFIELLDSQNQSYASEWSEPISFYPVAKPQFSTYGGLSENEIINKYSFQPIGNEARLLSETNTQQKFNPANDYIFKCIFDTDPNVNLDTGKENSILYSYEVSLIGYKSAKTTPINFQQGSVIGYATSIEIEKSGEAYLDTEWDSSRKSFYYRLKHNFFNDMFAQYELIVTYYTNKGYIGRHSYFIVPEVVTSAQESETINPALQLSKLECTPHPEKGSVTIDIDLDFTDNQSFLHTGTLLLERAINTGYGTSKTKELNWEKIYQQLWLPNLNINNGYKASLLIDDMTAEPGVLYIYRVRFQYQDPITKNTMFAIDPKSQTPYIQTVKSVILMLEDSFLATRDLTLRVRYNPELNSYKRNVIDIITPTLGGAYPFVRRNGAQRYRTFNIGGLISYNAELYEFSDWLPDTGSVFTDKSVGLSQENEFQNSLFVNVNGKNIIDTTYYDAMVKNGLITKEDRRIIYEKCFRDMVLDFLYDDQVILFKSQSEGNIFVRLSNVQFTPNAQLGRHIYSFTATATEVLEANSENYLEYFSPEIAVLEDTVYNIYLVAGYYDYKDETMYVGNGAAIKPDEFSATEPYAWNKNGVNGDEVLELHLDLKTQTAWEDKI